MPQLTPGQARVVDPVLSTVAQGFKHSGMVASALFPQVPVPLRGGNIITFGREDFMLYNSARAPGEDTKRVQFGRLGSPYALVDYSLEGMLPKEIQEEAENGGFTIDEAGVTIRKVDALMALRLEKQAADLARNAASYQAANKVTLAGASQWSDYGATSNPSANIETAKEAVRAAVGKRANTVVLGAAVYRSVRQHPLIIDRIKYTSRDSATPALLAELWGVDQVLIGDAIFSNDAGNAFSDVWGKDVVVAYTEVATLADMGTPSYGYTYNLNGYPLVEVPYYERRPKSWIFPVTRAESPVIASVNAGYLITAAVA